MSTEYQNNSTVVHENFNETEVMGMIDEFDGLGQDVYSSIDSMDSLVADNVQVASGAVAGKVGQALFTQWSENCVPLLNYKRFFDGISESMRRIYNRTTATVDEIESIYNTQNPNTTLGVNGEKNGETLSPSEDVSNSEVGMNGATVEAGVGVTGVIANTEISTEVSKEVLTLEAEVGTEVVALEAEKITTVTNNDTFLANQIKTGIDGEEIGMLDEGAPAEELAVVPETDGENATDVTVSNTGFAVGGNVAEYSSEPLVLSAETGSNVIDTDALAEEGEIIPFADGTIEVNDERGVERV